jgi:hypothetical protein
VGKDDINVFKLQVLQTLKSTLNDVFPGKTSGVVGFLSVGTEEDLGGDDVVSSVLVVSRSSLRDRGGRTQPDSLRTRPISFSDWMSAWGLHSPRNTDLSSVVGFGGLTRSAQFSSLLSSTYIKHVDTCMISFILRVVRARAYQHPKQRA